MKIGELSRLSGCQVETIRYYEKADLLPEPPRSYSNYRQYGDEHLKRLQFIKHCRTIGLPLNDIRTLISVMDPERQEALRAHEIVKKHITAIDQKLSELKKLRAELKDLEAKCKKHGVHDSDQCELIEELRHSVNS